MIEVRELRTILEACLSDLLGRYRFANGRPSPAFGVIKGNETYPPDGTDIIGLEAILFYPTIEASPTLTGYKVRQNWTLHLKQWQPGQSVNPAIERVLQSPDILVQRVIRVPAQERLGIPEGAQIQIQQFQAF